ncbi:hypothetical protein [Halomonas sp. WWR20]
MLTPGEVEPLFATLRQLASEGTGILFISHKLKEVQALCQTATVWAVERPGSHLHCLWCVLWGRLWVPQRG